VLLLKLLLLVVVVLLLAASRCPQPCIQRQLRLQCEPLTVLGAQPPLLLLRLVVMLLQAGSQLPVHCCSCKGCWCVQRQPALCGAALSQPSRLLLLLRQHSLVKGEPLLLLLLLPEHRLTPHCTNTTLLLLLQLMQHVLLRCKHAPTARYIRARSDHTL
jgi:hypothetical protein